MIKRLKPVNRPPATVMSNLYSVFRLIAKDMIELHAIAETLNVPAESWEAKLLRDIRGQFTRDALIFKATMRRPMEVTNAEWRSIDASNVSEILPKFYNLARNLCGCVHGCVDVLNAPKFSKERVLKIQRRLSKFDSRISASLHVSESKQQRRSSGEPPRGSEVVELAARKPWSLDKK